MKYFNLSLIAVLLLASCNKQNLKIVDKRYADSLINHYSVPKQALDNEKEMAFWKNRINPANPGQVAESRYASTLIQRFHEYGDINDVKKAEAVLNGVNKTFNNKLASPYAALTSSAMLQHHFSEADTLLRTAQKIGMETTAATTLSFDVDFELGRYNNAALYLKMLKSLPDYSYYFRKSKFEHLNGNIDSAITAMLNAADRAKTIPNLKGIALSNAADLYIHSGDLQKAGDLYKECIALNPLDFHSILGLGWVALEHDKNDTLAERIFKFAASKNKLPDALFKLYQMAQARGDKALEKQYANAFVSNATDTIYGKMYNKYVIEILTGILNQPGKAEALAKNELSNRATPQTYAWYAYTLVMNHKNDEAYQVFEQHVSGKPLEGLELYYMAKMIEGLGKGYNAHEFYKAAKTNLYDLSPDMQKELLQRLEE